MHGDRAILAVVTHLAMDFDGLQLVPVELLQLHIQW